MKTTTQIITELNAIVRETETFFTIQKAYFDDRTEGNLRRLRAQEQKVKGMIADSKKPIPSLI